MMKEISLLSAKKIMILGCCGAGKSTLSFRLGQKMGLPLIHLDKEYWQPNWVETPQAEWQQRVQTLLTRPEWIMDGNYSSTFSLRVKEADCVIWLDYSRRVCMFRVLRRIWTTHGKVRQDMSEGCKERWDWEFIRYVWNFHRAQRPRLVDCFEQNHSKKPWLVFKHPRELSVFLEQNEL